MSLGENRTMSRWAAIGLSLVFAFQVMPQIAQIDIVQEATAPYNGPCAANWPPAPFVCGSGPAQNFGQPGQRQWSLYSMPQYCSCEPTIGVAWTIGDGKTAMYQAYSDTLRLIWDDTSTVYPADPPMTFTNLPTPWYDPNSPMCPVGGAAYGNPGGCAPNYDPILWTDFDYGRTYSGGLWVCVVNAIGFPCDQIPINPQNPGGPPLPPLPPPIPPIPGSPFMIGAGCTAMAFTDDNGLSWTPSVSACAAPMWDHQSIGSGPWAFPIPPNAVSPRGVYYCAQYPLMNCWVSYDGGITFSQGDPSVALYCGGLHGHIRVSRIDGTVYVPNKNCGGLTGFVFSELNGQNWGSRALPFITSGSGLTDPSIGISENSGWIYVGQTEEGTGISDGGAWIAMSKDKGLTWEPQGTGNMALDPTLDNPTCTSGVGGAFPYGYFNVACLVPGVQRAIFADVIAGDDDRAAYSFFGSNLDANSSSACGTNTGHEWHLYVAMTYDAGVTWTVDKLTTDPVQRGPIWAFGGGAVCRNHLDFNDMAIDIQGRPVISFGDGCIACGSAAASTASVASVARLTYGKGLHADQDCSWICSTTNVPIGGVGNPNAGMCDPAPDPHVEWTAPADDALITVPTPDFDGVVNRLSTNPGLSAEAWGPYAGFVNQNIPIVGTADCTTQPQAFTCLWTPVSVIAPTAFTPGANSCATGVTYAQQGVYNILLQVTDSVSGLVATDIATIYVQPTVPPIPRCPGQTLGVLVDDDSDIDHGNFAGAPGFPAAAGTNEITCVGAYYNLATDQVEFHMYDLDSLFPVDQPTGTAEFYWFVFTPDFGDLAGIEQTIEVYWDGTVPVACFIEGPREFAAVVGPVNTLTRQTTQPNPNCADQVTRPVTATWNAIAVPPVDDLIVSFPVYSLNPVTGNPSASAGDHLGGMYAWAWHAPNGGGWGGGGGVSVQVNGCYNVGVSCANTYDDDDFSPDCKAANLRFVTPTKLGLASSCNPATPTSLSAGGGSGGMPTPEPVVDAVHTVVNSLFVPLGLPALPTVAGVVQEVEDLAGSLPVIPNVPSAPGLPALPPTPLSPLPSGSGPSMPSAPTSPSSPQSGPVPQTPGIPAVPGLPGLPGPQPSSPSIVWPPPPPPPPGVTEYVVVTPDWGASVVIPVTTSTAFPTDTYTTLLSPLSAALNGEHFVLVEWFDTTSTWVSPNTGAAGFLDDDLLRIHVGMRNLVASGLEPAGSTPPRDGDSEADSDGDGFLDNVDNCSLIPNSDQGDANHDGVGDACQEDADGDGIANWRDNCPTVANLGQRNVDGDNLGDLCDDDYDGDDVVNGVDNCPWVPNADQTISFPNLTPFGDACNDDIDGDGVPNVADACPADPACGRQAPQNAVAGSEKARPVVQVDSPVQTPASSSVAAIAAVALAAAAALIVLVAVLRNRRGA